MLKIIWDKEELEHEITTYNPVVSALDVGVYLQMYIDEIEISGLENIPGRDITLIITFFPDLLSFIQLFDNKLDLDPSNPHKFLRNIVEGGEFKFKGVLDEEADILTLDYTNKGIKGWRSISIPFKGYIEGSLAATKEIISDVERIAQELCKNDEFLISLKDDCNLVRKWYEKRYNEQVEEKYQIPEE